MYHQSTEKKSDTSKSLSDASTSEIENFRLTNTSPGMRFEAFEHRVIGNKALEEIIQWYNDPSLSIGTPENNIFQLLENKFLYNADHTFQFNTMDNTPFTLSAGELVALGGDFFGIAREDGPICTGATSTERVQRFIAAYNTLAQLKDNADVEMLTQLKGEFDKEYGAVLNGILKGTLPSEAMKAFEALEEAEGRERTFAYSAILSHENFISKLPGLWAAQSEYVKLLRYNFDHFGEDAKKAFKAGFDSAFELIRQAKAETNLAKKAFLLYQALTQLLFACHFLTDLFASGHVRTPRRALRDYVRHTSSWYIPNLRCDYLSGMLVHEMHDRDNERGLNVRRTHDNAKWVAYGDRCHFNPSSEQNRNMVVEAIVVAFKEIINFYHDKQLEKKPEYLYEGYIPTTEGCPNEEPMFEIVPNIVPETISIRGDLAEPPSTERSIHWNPARLWNRLKKKHLEKLQAAEHLDEKSSLTSQEQKRLWMEFFQDIPEKPDEEARESANLLLKTEFS